MTSSAKLGITSLALLLAAQFLLKPFHGILGLGLITLSILLGLVAGSRGSRWWWTVSGLACAFVVFLGWIILHLRTR
jgi:hypothetical protein